MTAPDRAALLAPKCPACGRRAAQVSHRTISEHQGEITASDDAGHLWQTRWFAPMKGNM